MGGNLSKDVDANYNWYLRRSQRSIWIELIFAETENWNWKYCSKKFLNVWIVSWDPFLMKKLLKSGICGSINSTWCTVCCRKVNICGYCSLNTTWIVTTFLQNTWKKKKEQKRKTQMGSKRRRVSKLAPSLSYAICCYILTSSTKNMHYRVSNCKFFHNLATVRSYFYNGTVADGII